MAYKVTQTLTIKIFNVGEYRGRKLMRTWRVEQAYNAKTGEFCGEEIQEWKGIELVGLCPFRHADKYNEISAKVKAGGDK